MNYFTGGNVVMSYGQKLWFAIKPFVDLFTTNMQLFTSQDNS